MKIKSNMNCNSGFYGQNTGKMAGAPYLLLPAGATLEVDEAMWDQFKDTPAIVGSIKERYIEVVEEIVEEVVESDLEQKVADVIPNLLGGS